MNLLMVLHAPPCPPDLGPARRHFHELDQFLARGHRVSVLSYGDKPRTCMERLSPEEVLAAAAPSLDEAMRRSHGHRAGGGNGAHDDAPVAQCANAP